jgi:hypothetical protein
LSNIKAKIKIEDNGNQKRFSTKIELKDPDKHKFLLKRKEKKPIHFMEKKPKKGSTWQKEKKKTKKEKPYRKPTESKKFTFFGKKKKDSMDGLSEINMSDKGPTGKRSTKIKGYAFFEMNKKPSTNFDTINGGESTLRSKHRVHLRKNWTRPSHKQKKETFFEKKKPLEKISDDHKIIAPLPSGLDVEKPFILPISETKFETVTDTEKQPPTKIELKDPDKHKFLLKRKEKKPIHFMEKKPKFGMGNYKINFPKRKRSNQKQATAKKITLFAGGKKGSNKIELDKAWGDARNVGKEEPYKKPTESKKLISFGKKKKDSMDGLSEINMSDKGPTDKRSTKIKRRAFFEKKKPLEKISDDHKTIAPLPSGLDIEKPFILPISETKFETVTDDEKIKLEDVERLKLNTLKKLGFSTKES